MQIHFDYDSSTAAAPNGFTAALAIAAAALEALIIDPIIVAIRIGWDESAVTHCRQATSRWAATVRASTSPIENCSPS
jgi:hypothetical protein